MRFVDARTMPVSVVRHEDTARLSEVFEGRRLPVARSVYFAIVQLVAEAGAVYGEATRKDLASIAGVTARTLDDIVKELHAAGLVHRLKRWEDGLNLPNLWALGPEPDGGVAQQTALPPPDSTQQSSTTTPEREKKTAGGGLTALPPSDDFELPGELRADAEALLRSKRRVGGKVVQPGEMLIAAAVIAEFNRLSGSEFGLGAHLTAIVGRIRERPSYDVAAHVRLVQSAWRLKWWERRPSGRRGRPTPAVIYGNERVFEAVVQDATDEKAGRSQPAAQPGRFERTKGSVEDEEF